MIDAFSMNIEQHSIKEASQFCDLQVLFLAYYPKTVRTEIPMNTL